MKNLGKRGLALFLTLVMCLGMLDLTAYAASAADTQKTQQVVNAGGSTTVIKDNLDISKTIEPTGIENYFDITLTATSSKTFEQMALDQSVAVVIVMDVSNTMNYKFGQTGTTDGTHTTSRAGHALSAAKDFMTTFASNSKGSNAKRQIGVVAFNTSAKALSGLTSCKTSSEASTLYTKVKDAAWDILDAKNYDTANSRFTNMEAGLKRAYAMLANSNCEHKYIVFLTDGFPTTYLKSGTHGLTSDGYTGYAPISSSGTKGSQGVFYDARTGKYCLYGVNYSDKAATYAQDMATKIKNKGIDIISIGVDMSGQSISAYEKAADNSKSSGFSTVDTMSKTKGDHVISSFKSWMKSSIGSGYYFDSESDGLKAGFDKLLDKIEADVRSSISKSWTVTDPVNCGSGTDFIDFQYFYQNDLKTKGGTKLTGEAKKGAENTASLSSDTINWNLYKSGWKVSNSKYVYTLKYRIRLDNEKAGYTNGAAKNTNGTTTLKYLFVKDNGTETTGTANYKIPQVKGYLASLTFTKVDGFDKALPGATFSLAHSSSCSVCKAGDASVSISTQTKTSGTDGKVSFTGIPSGHDYTLKEDSAPTGYTKSNPSSWTIKVAYGVVSGGPSGGKVVNPRDTKNVTVEVVKNWQGDDLTFRPADLTVTLQGTVDGKNVGNPITISGSKWTKDGNVWKANVTVPSVDAETGKPITYTVTEDVPEGYTLTDNSTKSIAPTASNKTVTLYNQADNETELTVTKVWADPKGQNNHDAVTVHLLANGDVKDTVTLSAENGWTHTFEKLPAREDGKLVDYKVSEEAVDGYTTVVGEKDAEGTITITNSIKQETVNIHGIKKWQGPKPTEAQIVTLTGTANGTTVYSATTEMTDNNTAFTFSNLPKYDVADADNTFTGKFTPIGSGALIVYTVSDNVTGFAPASASVAFDSDNNGSVTLTNKRPDDGYINLEATKIWVGDEGQEAPDRGTDPVFVLQQLVNGEWVNVEGVEPQDISGKVETAVEIPEPEVPETPEDEEGADVPESEEASEPAEIEEISEPQVPLARIETVTTYEGTAKVTFVGLPKLDSNGSEIQYRVIEEGVNDAYTPSAESGNAANGYTITNTLGGEETSVTVTKKWVDEYTGTGERPSVTAVITLKAYVGEQSYDNKVCTFEGAKDTETYTFEGLPVKTDKGEKINWVVEETTIPDGYESSVNGYVITNTVKQQYTSVTVQKVWNTDLSETFLPEITITLTGTAGANTTTESIKGSQLKDDLSYTWSNLPVYDQSTGIKWEYSVSETMAGDAASWFKSEVKSETAPTPEAEGEESAAETADSGKSFVITNTSTIPTTTFGGQKFWYLPNNAQPTDAQVGAVQITVTGTIEGENVVETRVVGLEPRIATIDGKEKTIYTYQVEDLPKYDAKTGKEITYTAKETAYPDGFTSTPDSNGKDFHNRSKDFDDGTVSLTVIKSWIGPVELRPEVVEFTITGDGKTYTLTLTADDGWSGTVENLPKYDADGNTIEYTVAEEGAELRDGKWIVTHNELDYVVDVDASEPLNVKVTNTLSNDEKLAIKGEKIWENVPEDSEFSAPEIQVQLYIDNEAGEMATLSEGKWSFDFGEFPKYDAKDGHIIRYEVREVGAVDDVIIFEQNDTNYTFDVAVAKDEDGSFKVTNTYRDSQLYYFELVTNYVTHLLDGTDRIDNEEGPVQKVEMREGQKDQLITAGDLESMFPSGKYTEYNGGTYTFDPDNEGNVLNVTLEKAGEVYRLILWYERTESRPSSDPKTTELTVEKVWANDEGADRPASVQVQLYRNNVAYGSPITLSEESGWSYTWVNLIDSYKWTVGEINVPDGYTSTMSQNGTVVTVTNTYDEGGDIPDPDVPLVEIPDDDPPLANIPEPSELPEEPDVDIPDDDVPLADVPETGDIAGLWGSMAALSAFGMALLSLFKKRKDEES